MCQGCQPMARGQKASELNFHHMAIKARSLGEWLPAAAGPLLKWMQHIPDLNRALGTSAVHTIKVLLVPRKARQPGHLL